MIEVSLREVRASDLDQIFQFSSDPEACRMVAFTAEDPTDRIQFDSRWKTILAGDDILKKTVVASDHVVGNIVSFIAPWSNQREIGYWFGREFWGRGYATAALAQFLDIDDVRPLHARAAFDNLGSQAVLQKCGFKIIGSEMTFAQSRGEKIKEYVLRLDKSVAGASSTKRNR